MKYFKNLAMIFAVGLLFITNYAHAADPVMISTCQQLQDINNDLSGDYELANDIDCTGVNFQPIGGVVDWWSDATGNHFKGHLDGKNHTISHLTITTGIGGSAGDQESGLFQVIGDTGVVENLKLADANVVLDNKSGFGGNIVGLLAGGLSGLVQKVFVQGGIHINDDTGGFDVGGLIGRHTDSGSMSSSPLLFAWNGTKYDYQADIGDPLPFFLDGQDYAHIDQLVPKDNKYSMKISEEYNEIVYFDQLKLFAFDHVPGYQVANSWLYGQKDKPEFFKTISETPTNPLIACTDKYGHDCVAQLKDYDGVFGYKDPSSINSWVMNFGDLSNAQDINFVFRAARDFSKANTKDFSSFIYDIDTIGADGQWHNVYNRTTMHSPLGTPRLVTVPLTGKFPTNDYRVRVTFKDITVDQFTIDTSPQVPFTTTEISSDSVNLGFHGYTAIDGTNYWKHDYDHVTATPNDIFAYQYGKFTKYGDVTPLLQNTDDKYVVMRHGDQMDITFPVPAIAEGQERSFMLFNDDYYKHARLGMLGKTTDPLPYNGMTSYPGSADPHVNDADYQNYKDTWNTRVYDAPVHPLQHSTIIDSGAEVNITVDNTGYNRVGGLVGENHNKDVLRSYAAGSASVNDTTSIVGGLIGDLTSTVHLTDSYARTSVSGGQITGGLVGYYESSGAGENTYATGSVNNAANTGGLVAAYNSGNLTNSFWDTATTGMDGSLLGTGKDTASMKKLSTFSDVGWDFKNVWGLVKSFNDGYPCLLWQEGCHITKPGGTTVVGGNVYSQPQTSPVVMTPEQPPSPQTPPPATVLDSGKCPTDLIITQNLKVGAWDGFYNSFTKAKAKDVKKLQGHINRILAEKYNQAAGPTDGIFGKLTKQGVVRLQTALNDILKPKPLLDLDGMVGPFTRDAINNSCGK
jgi:hypothetical protein